MQSTVKGAFELSKKEIGPITDEMKNKNGRILEKKLKLLKDFIKK